MILLLSSLRHQSIRTERIRQGNRSSCLQCLLNCGGQCHDHICLLWGNGQLNLLTTRCRSSRTTDLEDLITSGNGVGTTCLPQVLQPIPLA